MHKLRIFKKFSCVPFILIGTKVMLIMKLRLRSENPPGVYKQTNGIITEWLTSFLFVNVLSKLLKNNEKK